MKALPVLVLLFFASAINQFTGEHQETCTEFFYTLTYEEQQLYIHANALDKHDKCVEIALAMRWLDPIQRAFGDKTAEALCIVAHESRGNHLAIGKSGNHIGLFQIHWDNIYKGKYPASKLKTLFLLWEPKNKVEAVNYLNDPYNNSVIAKRTYDYHVENSENNNGWWPKGNGFNPSAGWEVAPGCGLD